MIEGGVIPELLLGKKYGHRLHVWDLRRRKHQQVLDVGDEHQMTLELRPAHDPTRAYGFMGCVVSVKDLSASVFLWYRDGDKWAIRKVITIPAEPADPALLPPLLKGFGAVPPLCTDINLSLDDKFLYVSCWGTGELRQYDVSDPAQLPSSPARCAWAGSSAAPRTPSPDRSPARRRWSRSAAMAAGSTLPAPCTRPGTSSSIRRRMR